MTREGARRGRREQAPRRGVLGEIAAERNRQLIKGWTPEHDDKHVDGEIGLAAALYAIPYQALTQDDFIALDMALTVRFNWDLPPEPDHRKRLLKAAALMVAEIERFDRAAQRGGEVR